MNICCIARKGCSHLFELFASVDCVGDSEPVISLLCPVSTTDQVHLTLLTCFITYLLIH